MTRSVDTTSSSSYFLKATMGDSKAKQYEYLLHDDDDDDDDSTQHNGEPTTMTCYSDNEDNDIVQQQQQHYQQEAVALAYEKCRALESKYQEILSHVVIPLQQQVKQLQQTCLQQKEQLEQHSLERQRWEQQLQDQQDQTKQMIQELVMAAATATTNNNNTETSTPQHYHYMNNNDDTDMAPTIVTPTSEKSFAESPLSEPPMSETPTVLQAGLDLADSLIQMLISQQSNDAESTVLGKMEVLDRLLESEHFNEHKDDAKEDERQQSSLQDLLLKEELHHDDDDNDSKQQLYKRIQQLEQERDELLQESLDMVHATQAACALELQVKLTEMQEQTNGTIQVRVMEELQKQRKIHVVHEW